MEAGRNRCDWKNAATAGLITGGFMGLPVALRAGEPRLALMAAGLTAGIPLWFALLISPAHMYACSYLHPRCFGCAGLTGGLDILRGTR